MGTKYPVALCHFSTISVLGLTPADFRSDATHFFFFHTRSTISVVEMTLDGHLDPDGEEAALDKT